MAPEFRPWHGRRAWRLVGQCCGLSVLVALGGCGAAINSLDPGTRTVTTARAKSLGTVLVDGHGRTLYYFLADPPRKSSCYGACAGIWPPVTTEAPPVTEHGVQANKIGTITRRSGRTQLTYGVRPLYYYQGDTKAGEATGEGLDQFGARWYVVSAAGG